MRQPVRTTRLPAFVPSSLNLDPGTSPFRGADEYAAAWEDWLRELVAAPSWFITLTFKRKGSPPPTDDHAGRLFVRWIRRAERKALSARKARNRGLPWVSVIESHADGTPHLHAILCECPRLNPRALRDAWTHGISQVEEYDEERGGTDYLVKQVHQGAILDLSRAFRLGF